MSKIQEDITRSVPLNAIREGKLDKHTWSMWLRELEHILYADKSNTAKKQPNLIIPLTVEGIYLKIILNGLRIESIALYEKSKSYRICVENNRKMFSTVMHDVHHINGLSPMQLTFKEKPSLLYNFQ